MYQGSLHTPRSCFTKSLHASLAQAECAITAFIGCIPNKIKGLASVNEVVNASVHQHLHDTFLSDLLQEVQ